MYDRYEPGSGEEGSAGKELSQYYKATNEPAIQLPNPLLTRIIDAAMEAVEIPHPRGQVEIKIPEKLKDYDNYASSAEYQKRIDEAQSRTKKSTRRLLKVLIEE